MIRVKSSTLLLFITCAIWIIGFAPVCTAFGLGSVTGLMSRGSNPSTSSVLQQQGKLIADFRSSQAELLQAQALFETAFGHKNQAAELRADAKALATGASEQDVEKAIADSSRANAQIDDDMKRSATLSAEGRKDYIRAIPPYAGGLIRAIAMRPDFTNFLTAAQRAIASASITDKLSIRSKLANGLYVAEHAPAYIGSLESTTGDLLSYAKADEIAIPTDALSHIPVT